MSSHPGLKLRRCVSVAVTTLGTTPCVPRVHIGTAEVMEVDKPIMSYKVVGSRIELHLLGGSVAVLDSIDYSILTLTALRRLASESKIPGRSKMNREELIRALESLP